MKGGLGRGLPATCSLSPPAVVGVILTTAALRGVWVAYASVQQMSSRAGFGFDGSERAFDGEGQCRKWTRRDQGGRKTHVQMPWPWLGVRCRLVVRIPVRSLSARRCSMTSPHPFAWSTLREPKNVRDPVRATAASNLIIRGLVWIRLWSLYFDFDQARIGSAPSALF